MFETQKEWCKDKIEKGKEFYEENKFYVGAISGCLLSGAISAIYLKIHEAKYGMLNVGPVINKKTGDWSKETFGVQVNGVDRFGKTLDGYGIEVSLSRAEILAEEIKSVIKEIENHKN